MALYILKPFTYAGSIGVSFAFKAESSCCFLGGRLHSCSQAKSAREAHHATPQTQVKGEDLVRTLHEPPPAGVTVAFSPFGGNVAVRLISIPKSLSIAAHQSPSDRVQ
jgi:hypothetical protein